MISNPHWVEVGVHSPYILVRLTQKYNLWKQLLTMDGNMVLEKH